MYVVSNTANGVIQYFSTRCYVYAYKILCTKYQYASSVSNEGGGQTITTLGGLQWLIKQNCKLQSHQHN